MLTTTERAAGRRFRDACQAAPTDDATWVVPPFLSVVRHLCPARGDVSTAIELKEHYLLSPADGDVPAGRFGWIRHTGRCRHCHGTVRTDGRIVDTQTRPPLHGAIVRQTPSPSREEHRSGHG